MTYTGKHRIDNLATARRFRVVIAVNSATGSARVVPIA